MSRLEEIKRGAATLVFHINGGYWFGYVRRSIVDGRLSVHAGGPKGKQPKDPAKRKKHYLYYRVEGVDGEFDTLDAAVAALDDLDRKKADAEGDAAAPPTT